MNPIEKILVPTDLGDPGESALAYAVGLADSLGAELILLHAFELPITGFPDGVLVATADLASRIVNASQKALGDAVEKYKGGKVKITPVLKQGDPREVILAVANDMGADLIVMGTHGRRGIARALIGSTTESVVRTAPLPVLTVHADVKTN
ncbi:MAG: universal stress protein [Labilithrix sp.]|nr:universal stress protein [Labilithrix sp.]